MEDPLTIDTLIEKLKTLRESHGNLPIQVPNDAFGEAGHDCMANAVVPVFPMKWNSFSKGFRAVGPAHSIKIFEQL